MTIEVAAIAPLTQVYDVIEAAAEGSRTASGMPHLWIAHPEGYVLWVSARA